MAHRLADLRLGHGLQAWPLTAAVQLGGRVTGRAVAAHELLDRGQADASDVANRLLRAEPALTGVQGFPSSINRIASHASSASGMIQ